MNDDYIATITALPKREILHELVGGELININDDCMTVMIGDMMYDIVLTESRSGCCGRNKIDGSWLLHERDRKGYGRIARIELERFETEHNVRDGRAACGYLVQNATLCVVGTRRFAKTFTDTQEVYFAAITIESAGDHYCTSAKCGVDLTNKHLGIHIPLTEYPRTNQTQFALT